MKFTYDKSTNTYTLETETRQIMLEGNEVAFISQQLILMNIRSDIEDAVKNLIEDDEIDMDVYDGTVDDLIEEVFVDMEDYMDTHDGERPDDNEIYDHVRDIMDFYEANRD